MKFRTSALALALVLGGAATPALAQSAGYDGVEVMGSEGYFLNQFLVTHVNRRTDRWGGSFDNRMRLPVEVVRRVRAAVAGRQPDLQWNARHRPVSCPNSAAGCPIVLSWRGARARCGPGGRRRRWGRRGFG